MKKNRLLSLFLVLVMAGNMLAGCTKAPDTKPSSSNPTSPNPSSSQADEEYAETIEYTLFAHNWNLYIGQEHDSVIKYLEEKFNVKLNITGAPWEGWIEKLNNYINTNDAPDMFFYLTDQKSYMNFVKDEVMLPIDEYLNEKTPNLKALFEVEVYENLKIDGHYYFMPNVTAVNNHAIYVRKDWMDNLGIKEPKTMEEFTEMLRQFTEEDPDKNGKKDTIGLTGSKILDWYLNFQSSFGIQPGWRKEADGTYTVSVMQKEFKSYLEWMSDLYSKGYLRNEFFLNDDANKEEDFLSGKAGVMLSNNGSKTDEIVERMKSTNPDAIVDLMAPPSGSNPGAFVGMGGFWGGWNISSKAKNPERLVHMLDFLISEEGQILRKYGIEGLHYTIEDGKYVPILENRLKEPKDTFIEPEKGVPTGNYSIGAYFGLEQYKFVDKNIEIISDFSGFLNPEAVEKSSVLVSQNLNFMQPVNVLDMPEEFTEIMIIIRDKVETIMIKAITGTITLEQAEKEFEAELSANGYAKAQKLLQETMEALGK